MFHPRRYKPAKCQKKNENQNSDPNHPSNAMPMYVHLVRMKSVCVLSKSTSKISYRSSTHLETDSRKDSDDHEAEASGEATAASGDDGARRVGADATSADGSADGGLGGKEAGRSSTRSTGLAGRTRDAVSGASLHRLCRLGDGDDGNRAGLGREVNLGERHGCEDGLCGAGAGDDLAGIVGAGYDGGGVDGDGGVDGTHGGGSRRKEGGNSGDDTRIAGSKRSADTLEENDGLGDDGHSLTVGEDALHDILHEDRVGAEALVVRVVLALDVEEEGVQALGHHIRAGKRVDRRLGWRSGGRRVARDRRRLVRGRWDNDDGHRGGGGEHSRVGLGDRADSSRDGDGHHSGRNTARAFGTIGNSGGTAGDGRDNRGEDGGGGLEAGDYSGSNFTGGDLTAGDLAAGRRVGADGREGRKRGRLGGRGLRGGGGRNWSRGGAGRNGGRRSRSRRRSSGAGGRGGRGRVGRGCWRKGRDGRDWGHEGGLRRVAVERNGMDVDAADRLGLVRLGREHDGHVLGATALLVDDSGTGLLARRAVLAGLAVGHVIMKFEVAVELRLHVDGAERELVDLGSAAEGRRALLVPGADTTNLLPTGALVKAAIASDVAAGETIPAEVVVSGEGAEIEVIERETRLLLVRALVVGVFRALKRGEVPKGERCCRTGSEGEEGDAGLHLESASSFRSGYE